MPGSERFITALKIHKRWADRYSIISIVLAISLMVAAAALAEMAEADAATRTGMMIVMATVVIVVCIWQAAGVVAAHIHELILDRRDTATSAR
jgi:hypothetical protein